MEIIEEIEAKREAILKEIKEIRAMRRGTINEQYLNVRHQGKDQPVPRGPYYVFSRREGGKTVSERLRSPEALAETKADVEAHKRFMALCREYERLTERLGDIERRDRNEVKKKPRSIKSKRKPR